MSLKTFFTHLQEGWNNFWKKEPQIESVITKVISGINLIGASAGSSEADIIAAAFPDGIGTKTLAEVKVLIPEALEVSTIASDALKASEGIKDPTEKANAVITTALTEAAKLPELQKEAHLLTIIAGIVSKVLHISLVEATHLVTAKQQELVAVPA